MIVVLLNVYLVILFCLVKFKVVRFNLFWKVSPVLVLLLLLIGLFIPMGWGAPQGTALTVRNSVAIVPDVAGEVVEVPVTANTPLKAGDVLFRIDPVPFKAKVDALEAQLDLAQLRLSETSRLQTTGAGRAFDTEQSQAEVEQLQAQLIGAKWDLEKTVVRAPADGYVTNLALRKGARVSSLPLAPVMAFIDTADTIIGIEVPQINARYVQPGQPVEATFKFMPGKVYPGKVESVLQAVATGQARVSGNAVTPELIQSLPVVVRIKLDDAEFADRLPAGSTGTAAIFTDHVQAAHVIRKVLLRQVAITNYVNPF
ncbi:efflux RND transporter periplasmic adaptor subunit [Pararhizobium sp. YC-54]|uniref:HlyD family secretion protein n=1 Tax=Pararhizobium sp. YC-54 TaxID=2986920 RepID=UPI0021F74DA1|nr:efflux RND transporter periplasmic adaptor subunit [Pararhizobium sp. YC-54]MCV9997853.1 efflux RND transporter periplasmic adaptor subunit [Pararhizobium sp. YC-54]